MIDKYKNRLRKLFIVALKTATKIFGEKNGSKEEKSSKEKEKVIACLLDQKI